MKYDDNDYYVSLIAAELNSLFPNIIKGKNDKFYYLQNNQEHVITFTEEAYEIEDLNAHLQMKLNPGHNTVLADECFKFMIDKGSGRCKIFLTQGYKIDFTKEDTFRNILGIDSVIIEHQALQPYYESPRMCDVVLSSKIYIHCDIVKGCIYDGKQSDILYSFPNDIEFGHLINIKPQFKREHLLVNKTFSEMNVYFTDQNNNPVTFMYTNVTLTFEIRQG